MIMRLTDGMIQDTEYGLIIDLRTDNLACATAITWASLFYLNGDQSLINEIVIEKIEKSQQELYTYVFGGKNDQQREI